MTHAHPWHQVKISDLRGRRVAAAILVARDHGSSTKAPVVSDLTIDGFRNPY